MTMAAPALLQVAGLTKRFGGLTVAADLDFFLRPGEIHSIIGPNGAGKTTFFNMITGFIRPDGGQIDFDGVPITDLEPDQRARLGIARSFQHPQIFPRLSVYENVRIAAQRHVASLSPFARIDGLPDVEEVATSVLEQVGLLARGEELAANLSHGDQKRLDMAMALAERPKLLLLDEPTAGMTIGETMAMAALVQSLTPTTTVLVIEHDMAFVRQISQRVTVLHRGQILADGSVAAIESSPSVQEAYLGKQYQPAVSSR